MTWGPYDLGNHQLNPASPSESSESPRSTTTCHFFWSIWDGTWALLWLQCYCKYLDLRNTYEYLLPIQNYQPSTSLSTEIVLKCFELLWGCLDTGTVNACKCYTWRISWLPWLPWSPWSPIFHPGVAQAAQRFREVLLGRTWDDLSPPNSPGWSAVIGVWCTAIDTASGFVGFVAVSKNIKRHDHEKIVCNIVCTCIDSCRFRASRLMGSGCFLMFFVRSCSIMLYRQCNNGSELLEVNAVQFHWLTFLDIFATQIWMKGPWRSSNVWLAGKVFLAEWDNLSKRGAAVRLLSATIQNCFSKTARTTNEQWIPLCIRICPRHVDQRCPFVI